MSNKGSDKDPDQQSENVNGSEDPYVVGIGASAGGLQALDSLFEKVPQDSVAYVVVQHLSTEPKSLLKELLARHTILKVLEAENNMPVEVNTIYLLPAGHQLTIHQNRLQLKHRNLVPNTIRTIDTFFTSLAEDKGARAVGIILSGTGTDGTEGIIAIKKANGLVLVQDPDSAKFDAMPRNAINSGYVDFILPPELMPDEIFNYVKVNPLTQEISGQVSAQEESSFVQILNIVHERTNIDFSHYKRPTIIRRLSRRMAVTKVNSLGDYLDFINLHPEEVDILSQEFLIGVTKFFRDQEAFAFLQEKVLPALMEQKTNNEALRIWVAGCSTGEEAYTIGILVREYLDNINKDLEVKIFASDIDREALEVAGKGLYPASSLTEVSEKRRRDYFIEEDGSYRVGQRVRRMVIFSPHNVSSDPPFSKIDLVSCRNMLIYLNPLLQKKIIANFHYALQLGGYLFLGASESIGDSRNFAEVNKKWKIFRNTQPARALTIENFPGTGSIRKNTATMPFNYGRDLNARQLIQQNLSQLLNETLLEEFPCAAIFIDENYDVIHGVGEYTRYLALPSQKFTLNLLKLVPADLSVSLGSLLRKAIQSKEKVTAADLPVRENDGVRHVNVVVKPYLNDKKFFQKFILLVFSEDQNLPLKEVKQPVEWQDSQQESRLHEMELELQHTKEDLHTAVEELETSNEELQSTNEELLSSNEELQSTNEELQSLNEELHTINTEHQYKIKALMELDDDLNNYFRSTNIGQIYVDRKLIIRKYTPAVTRQINLIESDLGRSIDHISNNLRYQELIGDIRQVIATTQTMEKEVQDKNGIWYQMRILPYITQEHRIDGAIVIFIEINELKNLHLLQNSILDSAPNAIFALKTLRNPANQIVDFAWSMLNSKAQEFFGQPEEALLNCSVWERYPALLEQGLFEALSQVVDNGQMLNLEQQLQYQDKAHWLSIVAVRLNDGLVLTLQDIQERKDQERALLQNREEIRGIADRLETMLEAFPHITWAAEPSGKVMSVNHYWQAYTGIADEVAVTLEWKEFIHPDDLEHTMLVAGEGIRQQQPFMVETRLRRMDGVYHWHLSKAVPVKDDAGQISYWVGTATDIQDLKDAEAATIQLRLRQQKEILNAVLTTQEAERMRISEALHNSLGQILYATRLNIEEVHQGNGSNQEARNKTLDLLNQAITTTRNISFELTPSILKDFGMKTAVEELILRVQNSKIKIDCDIEGFEERPDYLVELSLYRIIQELVNNILKHSGATRAYIELVKDPIQIILKVKDNGKGFDYKKLEKHKGLGLSSIRNRSDLLGGIMKVDSQPGKGTLVTITVKQYEGSRL